MADATPDSTADGALDAALDATPEGGCSSDSGLPTLGAPTFSLPDGSTVAEGSTITIAPPPGFPPDGVIFFTTDGTIPQCAGPGMSCTGQRYVAPIPVTAPLTTIFAVAAASCNLPSAAVHATYQVGPPNNGCDAGSVGGLGVNPASTTRAHPFVVSITGVSGVTACYRLDGNTPTCSAGVCTGSSYTYDAATAVAITPVSTDPISGKVTLTVIACDSCGDVSGTFSQTYQLKLAPPYLASTNADGVGLPGWDWSGTGAPQTSMTVPADAGAPYGPFSAQQVDSQPCTSPTICTGPANAVAKSICWSKGTSVTCGCADPLPVTASTPAMLPAAADVSPGDALSVIACGTPGYASSAVTTVQF
jgi:hypothetical protein